MIRIALNTLNDYCTMLHYFVNGRTGVGYVLLEVESILVRSKPRSAVEWRQSLVAASSR